MCTLHARGCDGMIAPNGWWHSHIYTECHQHESHMLACHTQPCEVRTAPCRRSRADGVTVRRSSGAAVVSDLVGDADVMSVLGGVTLGRRQSAGEER